MPRFTSMTMISPRRMPALLPVLLMVLGLMTPAFAQNQAAPQPVILELFTSQGCNSCPPADALMQDWLKQPGVIPISLHVDYWDYLGWKDTLSRKGHAVRQQDYARNSGKREVYTPQVVINGQYAVVGSDRDAVAYAIAKARKQQQQVSMRADRNKATGAWQIQVGSLPHWQGEAKLVLCRYDTKHEVSIERGENSGRTLNYLNVARAWGDLGRWKGQSASYDVPDLSGTDWSRQGVVIMLQTLSNDGVGPIIAAVDIKGAP